MMRDDSLTPNPSPNVRGVKIEALIAGLGLLVYALVTLGPFAALGFASTRWLLEGGAGLDFGLRQATLLGRSLGLALLVGLGATALGALTAVLVLLRRKASPHSIILASLALLALAMLPPYVHALTWMALVEGLSRLFPQLQAQGVWLCAWVQTMSVLPIAAGLALLGFASVESSLIEAARLNRRDFSVLLRVILPLAAPAILSSVGLCFLLSLTDYSIPSLFQVNVYTLEIFSEFSASGSPERAFLLSLPLLAACAVAFLALMGSLRNTAISAANRVASHEPHESPKYDWPRWFQAILLLAGGVWLAQAALPIVMLLVRTGSLGSFVKSATDARSELLFTLQVSLTAGLLCLPLALALVRWLAKGNRLGWGLALAPLALPAPLVGIGLVWIWSQPVSLGLYGSAWMPVLAMLARFSPVAALAILAQHRRTDPSLFEAGQIFQRNPLKRWLGVELPLLGPGLFAAAGIVLVLSAGELGATLITIPPGQSTLTLRIYNYMHYGASEVVAGLGLLVLLVTLAMGGLAGVAYGLRSAFSASLPVPDRRLTP